ncbi:MAG TPA: PDZ domain-containing protein [Planctomycetota bacterium]|jgi:hypothetical protein|nr:PDZ domain-containing protein [Planctomycetota bacterium]
MKFETKVLPMAALCGALSLLVPRALPAGAAGARQEAQEQASAWIEKLGAEDQDVRERAWDWLRERGEEVLPDLEKASKEAKDPEVRWNARLLSREIRRDGGGKLHRLPRRTETAPEEGFPPTFDRDLFSREFEGMQRQMGEMRRRLEEQFRNAPPGKVDRSGSSVRVESGANGSVRVEVTETRDGKQETKTYEAESWEEFRKNYPEVVEKYGLDGSGRGFTFRFGPRDAWGSWFDASPFLSPSTTPSEGQRLGVHVRAPSEEEAKAAGAVEGVGLVVDRVDPGSLAEAMKVRPGDVLLSIGGKPIRGTETIRRALAQTKEGATVSLEIYRDGEGKISLTAAKRRASRGREL